MDFAGRQNKTVQAFESMQKLADTLVDSGKRSKLGKAKFKVVMVIFFVVIMNCAERHNKTVQAFESM